MSMIFPGMDPYLEDPQLWPGVHSRFIVYLANVIQSLLGRRYITSIEERVFNEGPGREIIPDTRVRRREADSPESPSLAAPSAVAVLEEDEAPLVFQAPELEIHEADITILDPRSGQRIVTVIEVVSPTNKYAGPGRESYKAQQREVLASDAHPVEIDPLRSGPHVLAIPEYGARGMAGAYDYLICLNRAQGGPPRVPVLPLPASQPAAPNPHPPGRRRSRHSS